MRKMDSHEAREVTGGTKVYSCIYNDYTSTSYIKIYSHCLSHMARKGLIVKKMVLKDICF